MELTTPLTSMLNQPQFEPLDDVFRAALAGKYSFERVEHRIRRELLNEKHSASLPAWKFWKRYKRTKLTPDWLDLCSSNGFEREAFLRKLNEPPGGRSFGSSRYADSTTGFHKSELQLVPHCQDLHAKLKLKT